MKTKRFLALLLTLALAASLVCVASAAGATYTFSAKELTAAADKETFTGGVFADGYISTFGCVAAPLLGLAPGFGACIGMVALFCAAVNCPMASLFLAAEFFATHELEHFAVAVAVSFVLSGYFGLYSSQVHRTSKIGDAFISRKTEQ